MSDDTKENSSFQGQTSTEKPEWKKEANQVPDGGLQAWLVVAGAWSVLFCSFGWINSIGVFQEYYQQYLLRQYSPSTISWIPSLQIFFMYAMGAVAGPIYDNYGPRYLLIIGTFLHVFGLMMCSLATEYYQVLLSQGVCSAIGVSLVFQPAVSIIPQWFNKKHGLAYGIVASGSSIGGIIFPIMVERLIATAGFPWAIRAGAFMILFLLVLANLTIRTRVPPRPRPLGKKDLAQPFKEVNMMLVTVGFVLLTFGVFVPINFLVVEALSHGMPHNLAQYLLAILNGASFFGRLGAGALADKLGPYNVFIGVCYLAGIVILAIWIPATSNAAIMVLAVLFGFASGAYVALAAALVVKISSFTQIGYRIGLIFFCASVGGLTTNPIAGAIGSYTGMKIFAGVLLLAGTTLVLAARLNITGLKLFCKF